MNPKEIENIKLGAAVVAGFLALYFVFGKNKDNSGANADPTTNSVTPFNAKSTAESLFEAMKNSGTDEDAILETLKHINSVQFAQVVLAFGKRYYNTYTGNQYSFNPFSPLPALPLKTWLKEELSSSDYAILKLRYINNL
jgi:hypothetical protein